MMMKNWIFGHGIPWAGLLSLALSLGACSQDSIEPIPIEPETEEIAWGLSVDGKTYTTRSGLVLDVVEGGYLFQGDIVLDLEQIESLLESPQTRGGIANFGTWPNGIIYYHFAPGFPRKSKAYDAMNHFNYNTGIEFRPVTYNTAGNITQSNYVSWEMSTSGYAHTNSIGMKGGKQFVALLNDSDKGTAIHELGHVAGMIHEHARSDRDNYIDVNWSNIPPSLHNQWAPMATHTPVGTFDFNSIMIYGSNSNDAINPSIPMMTRKDGSTWGWSDILSAGDIATLQTKYPNYPSSSWLPTGSSWETFAYNLSFASGAATSVSLGSTHTYTVHYDCYKGIQHTVEFLGGGFTVVSQSPPSIRGTGADIHGTSTATLRFDSPGQKRVTVRICPAGFAPAEINLNVNVIGAVGVDKYPVSLSSVGSVTFSDTNNYNIEVSPGGGQTISFDAVASGSTTISALTSEFNNAIRYAGYQDMSPWFQLIYLEEIYTPVGQPQKYRYHVEFSLNATGRWREVTIDGSIVCTQGSL